MKIPTLPNLTSQVELIIKESDAANLREQVDLKNSLFTEKENVTNFVVCVGGLV